MSSDARSPDSPSGGPESAAHAVPAHVLMRFFDLSSDALLVVDLQGRVLFANPATCRMTGMELSELLRRDLYAFIHPDDWQATREQLGRMLQGELSQGFEARCLTAEGTCRWIEWNGFPVPELGAFFGIGRDVTAQKRVAATLRDSERRFRMLCDFAPVGIYETDMHGDCLFVNRCWSQLSGFPPGEALGKGWLWALHPADRDRITREWGRAVQEGRDFKGEYRYQTPDGQVAWLYGSAVALRDDAGTVTGYLGTVTDLTERKRIELALWEEQATLQGVIDNSPAVIYMKDRAARYVLVNRRYEQLFHKGRADLLARTDAELFPPEAAAQFQANDEAVMRAGKPFEFEEAVEVDGEMRTFLSSKFPLFDEDGTVRAVCGISTDITERKKLEQLLRTQYEQLKELDRLKSSFVDAVSHEIRTPLTSIMGYAEFLEEGLGGPLSPSQAQFVRELEVGARRLEYLVNDLLDFARLEAGTFRLSLTESDLAAKIREIAESLRPQIEEAELTLRLELPEEPVMVGMDGQRIGQVLINLLSNAIKFTAAGGAITVRVSQDDSLIRCEVEDTGEGIVAEDIPKLFQRFTQLSAGIKKGRGTGLGLSISKAFVEAHGGTIGVRSQSGQGSCFWFTLPLSAQVPTSV